MNNTRQMAHQKQRKSTDIPNHLRLGAYLKRLSLTTTLAFATVAGSVRLVQAQYAAYDLGTPRGLMSNASAINNTAGSLAWQM
jgi:hypothetical protein